MWGWGDLLLPDIIIELPDKRTTTFQGIVIKENLSSDPYLRILAFEMYLLEISIAHV